MKLELEQDVRGMLPDKDFDRRDFIWTALGASAAMVAKDSVLDSMRKMLKAKAPLLLRAPPCTP